MSFLGKDALAADHANSKDIDPYSVENANASEAPSKQPITSTASGDMAYLDYDTRTRLVKKYRTQFATVPSTVLSVLAGSPFENVKTRMQSKPFKNGRECIKYTYRTEGFRGFWAATTAPLIVITFTRVIGFSVYQQAKYAIDGIMCRTTGDSPLSLVNIPGTYPNLSTTFCFTTAGAISGVATTFFTCPIEVTKNATQTSVLMAAYDGNRRDSSVDGTARKRNVNRISSIAATREIVRRHGFLGLYTGFRLHLARDVAGSAIYFGVYEATKQAMTSFSKTEKANTPLAVATAGMLCGMCSWALTYPLDTMKTRVQNALVGNVSKLAQESAARASKFKGIEMMIFRSCIQNMIQMSLFEEIKNWINAKPFQDGTTKLEDKDKQKRALGRPPTI